MPESRAASTPANQPPEPVTVEDRRTAREEEYGKYVAVEPILGPGDVRIFNPGDPVPVSFVEGAEYDWLSKDDNRIALAKKEK